MQPTGVPQRARGARLRCAMAAAVMVAMLVASCGPVPNPPSPSEASAAVSVAPSVSPSPSPSPSPTPTPTPTQTPSPTPTPTASPTAAADIPACPGRVRSGHPVGAATSSSSRNWAGYVAASSSAGASCVEATWIEPTITCPSTGTRAVAIWVGIGGFSQTALVQLGTEASCRGGDSARISWQESLPQERSVIPTGLDVNAGHRIHAQVLWLGGTQYQVSMIDLANGESFSATITNRSLRRTSAEWIVEAPAVDCPTPCRILSMPRFSTISFSRVQTTWGGILQPLDGSSFSHQLVRMVTSGGSTRAQVTSTTRDGHAFKVVFRRA